MATKRFSGMNQKISNHSFNEVSGDQFVDFNGIWAPALTPVKDNYDIDNNRLIQHIHWLLENGCSGVVLFGTTGEAASFSASERMSALETVLASGVPPSRVIVGNGFPSATDTIAVTKHALAQGCTGVLMVPPFFFKELPEDALVQSYRYVFDQIDSPDLRVLLYHYPKMSAIPITHGLIDALLDSHCELIAGLKDSSGDWNSIGGFIEKYPELSIFPGSDEHLLHGLLAGGVGTITATADVNPAGIRKVYDIWEAGDNAESAQADASAIRSTIFQYPLAPALKAIHAFFRKDTAWATVRPPMMRLSESDTHELLERLDAFGFRLPGI